MISQTRVATQTHHKKILCVIACIVLCIHTLLLMFLLHLELPHTIPANPEQPKPEDAAIYHAGQLLSAGSQPATVIFSHEIPHATRDAQPAQDTAPSPHNDEVALNTTRLAEQQPSSKSTPKYRRRRGNSTNNQQEQRAKLQQFTQGFLQSMQQEAGYNQPAVRDIKQLPLQIYASKLWHVLKQSFLAEDNTIHLSKPLAVHTQLIVTIARNGALEHIALLYPEHETETRLIEQLIINRARKAGLFPPLPPTIGGNQQTFCFPLFIRGQSGLHTYSLSYQ